MYSTKTREYETAIAPSPVRHAIFNRPFSHLRKKTEVLLDTITGGTVSSEVERERYLREEKERALMCRGCKLIFADQTTLTRHHNLFPAHISPPRKPKNTSNHKRPHRSHSTSDTLDTDTGSTPRPPQELPQAPRPIKHSHSANALSLSSLQNKEDYARFRVVGPSGVYETSSARRVPQGNMHADDLLPYEERNREAGATSAARFPPLGSSKQIVPKPKGSQPGRRRMASDSAVDVLGDQLQSQRLADDVVGGNPPIATSPVSPSFANVVRAVIATGASGSSGQAVSPTTSYGSPIVTKAGYTLESPWVPLPDDEEGEKQVEPRKKKSTEEQASTNKRKASFGFSTLHQLAIGSGRGYHGELSAPTSPQSDETVPASPLPALTSFSYPAEEQQEPSSPSPSSSFPRLVPKRRSTNPFLSMSPNERTPPLDASSPRFLGKSITLSPKNLFAKLDSGEMIVDDPLSRGPVEGEKGNIEDMPITPRDMKNLQPNASLGVYNSDAFEAFLAAAGPNNAAAHLYGEVVSATTGGDTPWLSSQEQYKKLPPKVRPLPPLPTHAPLFDTFSTSVRFEAGAAKKAYDNPRCPSCRETFLDVSQVTSHLDSTDCGDLVGSDGISA